MLSQAEARDQVHQETLFRLRNEGLEYASLLHNTEQGARHLLDEAMRSGHVEVLQRNELTASSLEVENTRAMINSLTAEVASARNEQARSMPEYQSLISELRQERDNADKALGQREIACEKGKVSTKDMGGTRYFAIFMIWRTNFMPSRLSFHHLWTIFAMKLMSIVKNGDR